MNRWVLADAPLIERRLRTFRRPHCGSIRIDETYIKVRGQWRYLYRAIDKHGTPVDFLVTAKRDLDAAKRFFRRMQQDQPLLSPDRIGTDGAGAYPPAITAAKKDGLLARTPAHYVTKHLQQGIESDHFRVSGPCRGWAASRPSTRRGVRSRGLKRCRGCARASALPAAGRCASRTGCSQSVSVSQRHGFAPTSLRRILSQDSHLREVIVSRFGRLRQADTRRSSTCRNPSRRASRMALRTVVSETPARAATLPIGSVQAPCFWCSAATTARTACSALVESAGERRRQGPSGGPAAAPPTPRRRRHGAATVQRT